MDEELIQKGIPFDYCLSPDAGLPLPDIVVYLTVPPETAAARSAYGTERYETVEIQLRVREQFRRVAREFERQHGNRWKTIDARGTIEEVEEQIQLALRDVQPGSGELWQR